MGAFLSGLGSALGSAAKGFAKDQWGQLKSGMKGTVDPQQPGQPVAPIGNTPALDQQQLPDTLGIAYHAEGGQLDPSKVNVVGEGGPEVIVGDRVFSSIPNLHSAMTAPETVVPRQAFAPGATYQDTPMIDVPRKAAAPQEETPMITVPGSGLGTALPKRAEGGPVDEGQPYEVGEKGPEVIVPDQDGTVIPNDAQAAPVEMAQAEIPVPLTSGTTDHPNARQSGAPPATATGKPKMQALGGGAVPQGTPKNPTVRGAADIVKDDAGNGYTKDENGNWVNIVTREPHSAPAAPTSKEVSAATPLGGSARDNTQAAAAVAPTPEQIKAQSQVPATNVHTPQELAFQRSIIKDKLAQAVLEKDPMKGMMDTIIAEKQQRTLNAMNPYGSEANHPGILGKIEHGLAAAGNIAGDIVAPGTMANIPGTAMNQEIQAGAQDKQLANLEGEQADIALKNAQAVKATTDAKAIGPKWNVVPGMLGPQGQPIQQEQTTGQIRYAPDVTAQAIKPPGPGDDRAQFVNDWFKDPANFVNGKAPERTATNIAKADQAYTDVTQKAPIAGVAPNAAGGQTAFAARPGQPLPAGAQPFTTEAKDADKWVAYADKDGVHYAQNKDVPAGTEVNEVDPKTYMNEARAANTVQQSLNRISEDVDKHPELWDNAAARDIMATTLEQVDRASAAMLVAGTGGSIPLPSGLGDMINTALQNKVLDKPTADALKHYIADYKGMKDQAIVMQMELQGGKIGRGSVQAFNSIVNQIPNGATPDGKTAAQQLEIMQQKQNEMSSKYPEKYGNYTKEKPYTKTTKGAPELPTGATHLYRDKSGNVVGYALDGKYQALKP